MVEELDDQLACTGVSVFVNVSLFSHLQAIGFALIYPRHFAYWMVGVS